QILAGNRKFSKNAVDLTAGPNTAPYTFIGGSSSVLGGRIVLPAGNPLRDVFGCSQITVNPGATGNAADTANYHCFTNADKYNYATVNLINAPTERTSAFLNGTYHLTDNVDAYLTVMHSKTSSSSQLAPSVITSGAGLTISADSYYNPFGLNFGPGLNTFALRGAAIGPRRTNATNNVEQVNTGLKGRFDIGNQNWTWDAGFGYGHTSLIAQKLGLPNLDTLNGSLGPSFLDPATGLVTCGTPDAPIAGCVPINIFNINNANADPASIAAIRAAATTAQNTFTSIEKYEHLEVSGGLFDLPAGTVQLAGGVSHRSEYTRSTIDSLLNIDPATNNCTLGSQCAAGLQGGYTVKEAYAEVFVPILKDIPFVHALNVTLGDRFSKYNTFGSTNNWKVALEYRPIEDLLFRGTVSKVFRAPTVGDVFGPAASSAPTLSSDPCDYAAGGASTAGNPACRGVPATGGFTNFDVLNGNQINATSSGSNFANFPLGPELGKSFDFGVVYDPNWLEGLSVGADLWRVYLLQTISGIGAQTILNLCYNGTTSYCPLITRNLDGPNAGQITNILQPTGNLGRTDVSGVDVNLNYRLPEFSFGKFSASINATYLKNFNVDTAPNTPGDIPFHLAGHFIGFGSGALSGCPGNTGVCTLPRWKATTALNWGLGNFDASWRMRYFGRYSNGNENLDEQQSAYPGLPGAEVKKGANTYNDISFGYNIEPINTRIDLGVDNVGDKQPPFFGFDSQTLNAGTDPSTFDLVGRYYHASVTVKF
ncbi:MAG: TonB-dependent receptor, partial [Dokdonella sp.]|uniref:TonB-dependent receptor domain-containing protein n=1 Tax=Dokdonella sp. TaxID=2291710 RepID=UPI0032631F08